LRVTLAALHARLHGALAPLSGRPLSDLDALLALPSIAGAGLHGAELRAPGWQSTAMQRLNPELDAARARASEVAAAHAGVIIEDKGAAIALHYRAAPEAEIVVRRAAIDMLDSAGPDFELLQGDHVIELKPAHANKGKALATLMRSSAFIGRTPWMLGDDVTDEDAFAAANVLGGVSIIVGPRRPTLARYTLANPSAARVWLANLLKDADSKVRP
jgi:trehalose 6-phosphate phosphatase